MKRRRHRLERSARWGCTALVILAAASWLICRFYVAELIVPAPLGDRHVLAFVEPDGVMIGVGRSSPPQRFSFDTAPRRSTDTIESHWPAAGTSPRYVWASVPYWSLVAAGAIGSAWLWRRRWNDRRRARAELVCEQCDYPRAGLAPGAPCPECGTLPTPEAAG